MDTTRNHAEILALVARAEQHLGLRDAEGLLADLRDLEPCTIYSGNEAYERWKAIRQSVVECLYECLPLERFLEITVGSVLSAYGVLGILDPRADVEQAMRMMERFGGCPSEASRLFSLLAEEPGEEMTARLLAWTERYLATCTAWGAPSSVRPLVLLHRRGGEAVRQRLEEWFWNPPWKNALGPSLCVLSCLADDPGLLEKVAESPSHPKELRLAALTKLPGPAIPRVLQEALRTADRDLREHLLVWLDAQTWSDEEPGPELERALREANLASWPFLEQGLLEGLLRQNAPRWPRPSGISPVGRLALAWVAAFERVRVPLLGCGFFALIASLGFLGYTALLDRLIGPERLPGLAWMILGGWILVLGWTSRPDFAASLESLPERLLKGVVLFLATGALLIVPWLARL